MGEGKICFNSDGVDYEISKNGNENGLFFEFEGNIYQLKYDAVASLIRSIFDVVNNVQSW